MNRLGQRHASAHMIECDRGSINRRRHATYLVLHIHSLNFQIEPHLQGIGTLALSSSGDAWDLISACHVSLLYALYFADNWI